MENKKGFIGLIGLGIISTIILIFILFFIFSDTFKYTILGTGLIIMSFILLLNKSFRMKQNVKVFLFLALIGGGLFMVLSQSNFSQSTIVQTDGTRIVDVVPVMASITCEPIDSSTSTNIVYSSGIWLSKGYIGVNSKTLRNIKITSDYKQDGGRPRVVYKVCDSNRQNCGNEIEVSLRSPSYSIELPDIDLTRNSYLINIERSPFTIFGDDVKLTGQIQVTYDKFGLVLNSPTYGKRTVCASSCDLSCPSQSIRSGIVSTTKSTLNFYESTNYIEYWNEPSRISEQLGGTIWNSAKNEFCFGGYIYKPSTLETETGTKYKYPATYDRKEECCVGATIQITNGVKVCGADYKFKTILNEEEPECKTDLQCPNQGVYGGLQIGEDLFKSKWTCESGKCTQTKRTVDCIPPAIGCASDQICQNFKCVGGLPTPQIVPEVVEEDTKDLVCEWYESSATKIEKDYGWLYWRAWTPFVKAKETPITYCKISNWVNLVAISSIIIILGAIAIISTKPKRRRK